MHTEIYCNTLAKLDRTRAIRAIHQAYLQLATLTPVAMTEGFDNEPALRALVECLREAGHMGFNPKAWRV